MSHATDGDDPYSKVHPFPGRRRKRQGLEIEHFDTLEIAAEAPGLIEDAFDLSGLAVIYGPSNSGKTFWTMDAALHIAAGQMWRGKRVHAVPVLYLALEGGRGAVNRIVAWRRHHGAAGVPFWLVRAQVDLLRGEADVEAVRAVADKIERLAGKQPGLIVVDTLARAMMGGNENSPEDMGALVSNADAIREHTGGSFWFVHHSGKDEARGARGHSSLRAATDTEIEIAVREDGARSAKAVKQREMEMLGEWNFRLEQVVIAEPPGRKPITSCVVEQIDAESGSARPRRRATGQARHALEILHDVIVQSGRPAPGSTRIPDNVMVAKVEDWRREFYLRAMPDEDQDTRKKAFGRARDKLAAEHFIAMYGADVWIA